MHKAGQTSHEQQHGMADKPLIRRQEDVHTQTRQHSVSYLAKLNPSPSVRPSRSHPFTSKQFHALLNSLFKVLCNFPSRYLFAIGLVESIQPQVEFTTHFGLHSQAIRLQGRCLTRRDQETQPCPTGLAPSMGDGPSQGDLDTRAQGANGISQTPHCTLPRWQGLRCWAVPASLAVTKGILVSFFSSA